MKGTLLGLVGSAALVLSLSAAWAGSVTFLPTGPATFRWLDIGDDVYGKTFLSTDVYSGATVSLTYSDSDSSFHGTLSGSGLKPNFAYQLKLEGKPTALWGTTAGDDQANEELGYAGRWWMDKYLKGTTTYAGGANSTDAEYEKWKAGLLDSTYWYVFKGYLMFDYVVTTPDGTIPTNWGFIADSSFHVLWKTTQRRPARYDSTPTSHTISFTSAYYDAPLPSNKTVSLYGEWEPTRDLPGQMLLPLGAYKATLVLTEESFHSTTSLGGSWAKALAADVTFTISTPPPPAPGTLAGTVKTTAGKAIYNALVTVKNLSGAVVASGRTGSTGNYTIPDLPPATYTVTASATGYKTKSASATIVSGATKTLNFTLSK